MFFEHPVILFYQYTRIECPAAFVEEQRALCRSLRLKGRVLIALEGINGTLAGQPDEVARYVETMRRDARFAAMEYKWSKGTPQTFGKLIVKARREIVSLNLRDDVDVSGAPASHLTPAEWKARLDRGGPDLAVIDVRNRYESDAGRFEGALTPAIEHFRDLPGVLGEWEHLKDKTVLMYCTGGIRCEKAAALLRREGFREVHQLHGGILNYHEQIGRAHWAGDCFVFDRRMIIPGEGAPAGRCACTGRPTNRFVNCLHDPCDRLYLLSPEAEEEDAERRLCPPCRAAGLTVRTADQGKRAAR